MHFEIIELAFYFFLIALVYSSAGFGGGSSYLAVLALFSLPFTELRMIALLCNITVVSGSVILMWKSGHLQLKRIFPLIFISVPMAYIGGRYKIEESAFFILLAVTLILAALLMLLYRRKDEETEVRKLSKYSNGIIGGGIGLLSGVVGIGGGIFLSPILHISRWGKVKTIAATTALFILVNSIAGLAGQVTTNGFTLPLKHLFVLMSAVLIGGQIGIRTTIKLLNPSHIKTITGLLILLVGVRLLLKYLF